MWVGLTMVTLAGSAQQESSADRKKQCGTCTRWSPATSHGALLCQRLSYTPLTLMYRVVLACKGVPADVGAVTARDITEEFTHRPWHRNVHCEWDGSRLILQADNDFDSNGLALLDEFSDAISASITDGFDGGIDVVSVSPLPTDATTN
jgi:hypothetical protein